MKVQEMDWQEEKKNPFHAEGTAHCVGEYKIGTGDTKEISLV